MYSAKNSYFQNVELIQYGNLFIIFILTLFNLGISKASNILPRELMGTHHSLPCPGSAS